MVGSVPMKAVNCLCVANFEISPSSTINDEAVAFPTPAIEVSLSISSL